MTHAHATGRLRAFALMLLLTAVATVSVAQYKVVGPDGRVTYTDRPPPSQGTPVAPGAGAAAPAAPAVGLPFELRQVAARFPVTLYTAPNCAPCEAGRQQLRQRGVPHSERRIETPQDAEALQRLTGAQEIPVLRIGGQVLRGYDQADWTAYLDAAGYPRQSVLPASYRHPPATPLVASAPVPEPAAAAPAAAAAEPTPAVPEVPPPLPPAGNAPPGFRF